MKRLSLLCLLGLLPAAAAVQADVLGDFLRQRGLSTPELGAPPVAIPKASEVAVHAMGFLGVPYRWGGNDAQTGLDCSGFVQAVFRQVAGIALPRTSDQQAAATQAIASQELAPGDLVFFNTMGHSFSHVGIYIGQGQFVHAPRTGARIKLERLAGSYWIQRFDGARRVLATETSPVPSGERLSLGKAP